MLAHVLLEMLVDPPPGDARRQVWRVVVATALIVLGAVGLVAAVWLLVWTAIYGWQVGDWGRMEGAQFLPTYTSYLPLFTTLYLFIMRPVPRPVHIALLATLQADDDALAPVAEPQPQPLSADELADLAAQPLNLERLRAFPGGYTGTNGMNPLPMFLAMLIMFAGIAIDPLTEALGNSLDSWRWWGHSVLELSLYPMYVGMSLIFLQMVLYFRPLLRQLRVTVDERGLAWRRGPWAPEQRVEWSGIQALWQASYTPRFNQAPMYAYDAYFVDTTAGVFGWRLLDRASAAEEDASAFLTRLIVTRAGVPLRVLTPLMDGIRKTKDHIKRLRASALPVIITAPLIAARKRSWRVLYYWMPTYILTFLLLSGPFMFGHLGDRLQTAQHAYFVGLAPHIVAQTPLYHDALAKDAGRWPVSPPSAANQPVRRAFVGGAYTMSGQAGQFVMALGPRQFGDAAVAVTVRDDGTAAQSGAISGSATQDGVGLVLRASADGRNFLVFYVSADGTWNVEQYRYDPRSPGYSWNYVDSGESTAIQRGDNATNRLLVLARGQVYLCYVNGVLVDPAYAGFYNAPQNALASGFAGVFLNNGADTGSYSDFTVYPVQSPPSLSYV